MKTPAEPTRKITVNLPVSLLDSLVESENRSLTEILREALKDYRHRRACEALIAMRGKVDFDLTYEEIKRDRE